MNFTTLVKEDENGYFIELPDEIVQKMNIQENDELDLFLMEDRIVVRKAEDIKMFDCCLYYLPADVDYTSDDIEFWNEADDFAVLRSEEERLPGKVAAYELAKKRAAEYATKLGVQLKYYITLTDGVHSYQSNTYLSKKPKTKK